MAQAQTTADDAALLAAFAAGDRQAALVLTQRLTPRVMGQAYRMLGNRAEAEDVTQEAMMRLWKIAPDWQAERAQVTTWLYRVVANLCTDRLRKSGRGVALDAIAEPEDDAPSAADGLQTQARAAALQAALADLPDRQAQAVALRHLEELGNPRIAEIMDTNVRTVESLIARGKRALMAKLSGRKSELGYDDDTG
ncbi:RNA polymerase sigma factor [Pseudooctadecabacter sp.]|uniref:RNA polymerase sigma factor n=1 Tax=Pseudooctadecabacter sp. TaxID=1966338 RepID=UPI0025FFA7D6|nr:RNA polymerase sigma factor [Pseudooctadecabacter sp.]